MKALARLHRLDDAGWARHANPWSIWTRVPIGPALVAAIWWRAELGWVFAPVIAVLLVWAIVNPRAFPPPRDVNRWDSQAVLGERIWVTRKDEMPSHHIRMARITFALSTLGLPALIHGLWVFDPGFTLGGLAVVLLGKFWFPDRMVWLCRDLT